jgi:hypothetical protein
VVEVLAGAMVVYVRTGWWVAGGGRVCMYPIEKERKREREGKDE